MGCLLMLKVLEKLHWEKALHLFPAKLILDAPDVPTHTFLELVQQVLDSGCVVLHFFNPKDSATDMARQRHGDVTCPGNHCIMSGLADNPDQVAGGGGYDGMGGGGGSGGAGSESGHWRGIQAVDCSAASSSDSVRHNYGRTDGYALMDQRDFLAGCPPSERLLEMGRSKGGDQMLHWVLRTGR